MAFFKRSKRIEGGPEKRPKKPWKLWLKRLIFAGLALGVVGLFAFTLLVAWVSRDLPDPNSLSTREVPQSTKIYDRTGTQLLYEIHGDEKRTLVKIDDIPVVMQHATVAIEDKKFYEHHGVYWKGLIRAFGMSVLTQTRVRGTSTLTQQFVKNALLSNERSLMRKVREFVLALQIERTYSKDQILQLYLNEIPYGSNIYGIESAAQTYFGKPAKNLTLDEAALLAAIPQAPDLYSPYGTGTRGDNRDLLVARQHYVITQMAEQGYITQDEATAAQAVKTLDKILPKKQATGLKAEHFVMYVRGLLVEKYGQKRVEQGGLQVITTLDWDKQQIADREVKKGVDQRGKAYKFTNAALVSLDPKTGQILAMVGSKDYYDDTIDGQVNVTLRPRQPGSSFKPIVYAQAFARGYLPQTQVWDVNTTFKTEIGNYDPRNYDLKEHGPISLRQALQGSLNIPAVEMLYLVGIGRTLDFAEQLGYTTLADRSRFGLSLVLGGGEVKPIEHAAAFAAFANDGVSMPTSPILKVQDNQGAILEEWHQDPGKRVLDTQSVRLLSNVLSDNQARTYVFGAKNSLTLPDRPVAAKTGTTNNFKDAWTVGYTPNLVTAVWVGNSDGTEMKRGADGSVIAAPIWQGYMRDAVKGMPIETFKAPESPTIDKPAILGTAFSQKIKIDTVSGKRATDFTPPELIEEREYFQPHSILFYIDKDDPTGPPPTNPARDPQFENWERAVQTWISHATATVGLPPTEYDDIHGPDVQPHVILNSPTNGQILLNHLLPVQANVDASRAIARVDVVLNGVVIGSSTQQPWNFTVTLPQNLPNGFHQVNVVAIDDAGNRGETQVNIQLNDQTSTGIPAVSNGPAVIKITQPTAGTTWQRLSFPRSVDGELEHPEKYRRIELRLVGINGSTFIAAQDDPSSTSVHFTVTAAPSVGEYTLQILGTSRNEREPADVGQAPIIIAE